MSAVGGLVGLYVHDVERVLIPGIGNHVHVVPRPLPQTVARIHQLPRLATIVGPIESAVGVVRLDQRIYAIGIRTDRHADLSVRSLRQSMLFQSLPRAPAIVRAIESAARAAAFQAPRGSARLPQRTKKNVGISGVERDINAARVLILIQNLFPGLSAISR